MQHILIPNRLMPDFIAWCAEKNKSLRNIPMHGNGNIVRVRRRKHQYIGVELPQPPDAA